MIATTMIVNPLPIPHPSAIWVDWLNPPKSEPELVLQSSEEEASVSAASDEPDAFPTVDLPS